MKTIEKLFQETQIHFILQNEGEVMVNATEMAKAFGKRIDHFLKSDHAQAFIKVLEFTPYGGNSEPFRKEQIIQTRGSAGTFFNRILALKFAAWLDPEFEVWVFSQIDNILFANYKKHWEAHARQEIARERMEALKKELLLNPTPEKVQAYFEAEREHLSARSAKSHAIKNHLKMF